MRVTTSMRRARDFKEGNYRPRRMGDHGSIGAGAGCAGAASGKAPATPAYGGHPEVVERGLPAGNREAALGSSQMQAQSGVRSGGDLSGIRTRGWIELMASRGTAFRKNEPHP